MKVLTLKQPYATLIAEKKKLVEVRSWKTKYRGPLYIHAGLGVYPKRYLNLYRDIIDIDNMPKGKIIAKCDVVDCVYLDKKYLDYYNKKNGHTGYTISYENIGYYGFVLENIEVLDDPIEIKGKLGIWNLDK